MDDYPKGNMKILLIGKNGQLGCELNYSLSPLGTLTALDYPDIDLTDPLNLETVITSLVPEVIINAAGYTDVDKAESQRELVSLVNAESPVLLARLAKKVDAVLIHYSTDYVFSGSKGSPYLETDMPGPLSWYAETKLAGEQGIQEQGGNYLIFRTSWMYSLRSQSFLTKVIHWATTNNTLHIVDDQISNPTWARMLAEATAQVISMHNPNFKDQIKNKTGIYHVGSVNYCSRYDWAVEILKLMGLSSKVPIQRSKTTDFPSPAQRPLFSAMDCTKFIKTFNIQLPPWQRSLVLAMTEYQLSSQTITI